MNEINVFSFHSLAAFYTYMCICSLIILLLKYNSSNLDYRVSSYTFQNLYFAFKQIQKFNIMDLHPGIRLFWLVKLNENIFSVYKKWHKNYLHYIFISSVWCFPWKARHLLSNNSHNFLLRRRETLT